MNKLIMILLVGLPLLVSACGSEEDAGGDGSSAPPRSVVVMPIVTQKLDIKIALPVLVNPTETIELRAAVPGVIFDLPYSEGDIVPASEIPKLVWTDEADYVANLEPDAKTPDAEELTLRNLQHLRGLKSFARIDDNQLIESFVDAQANYDNSLRTLERTKLYSASTEAQLDAARTGRIRARAAVNRVLGMIQNTLVCNPREGILTKRYRQKGEFVSAGELLGTIAVVNSLKATVQVPEASHKSLIKGDSVSIWLPSLKRTCVATVTHVSAVAHPSTHSFNIDMSIPNYDLTIPAGIFGEMDLSIYKAEHAVVVPLTAIRLSTDKKYIYLFEEGIAREVPIIIGQISKDGAEILLAKSLPGKMLITVGAQYLADGDAVSASETDPAEGKGKQP